MAQSQTMEHINEFWGNSVTYDELSSQTQALVNKGFEIEHELSELFKKAKTAEDGEDLMPKYRELSRNYCDFLSDVKIQIAGEKAEQLPSSVVQQWGVDLRQTWRALIAAQSHYYEIDYYSIPREVEDIKPYVHDMFKHIAMTQDLVAISTEKVKRIYNEIRRVEKLDVSVEHQGDFLNLDEEISRLYISKVCPPTDAELEASGVYSTDVSGMDPDPSSSDGEYNQNCSMM
ncbi:uncharacterized protein F4822DRAFT_396718 [Hypoxylon trugodes]|uniref:uncharacterized protein n=1 Tax=Hypoxylon trugodes TaxID=326681 RepID=UPI0021939D57|nr:uncharacterized protein F4822DRAFT_396718 [Hypoxylon trugodes]KAI1391439.1 hypothetical protein F4822DRAFT_396718 [Hypoxylon trugodes]